MAYQLLKKSTPILISLLLVGGAVVVRYDIMNKIFPKEISYSSGTKQNTESLTIQEGVTLQKTEDQESWQSLLDSFSETTIPFDGAPSAEKAVSATGPKQPLSTQGSQTLTKEFAKSLVDQYVKLQTTAPDLPFEAIQNVAFEGKFLNDAVDSYFKEITPLTAQDVITLKDNSTESKKLYLNRVASILKTNFPFEKTKENEPPAELEILLNALKNEQYADLVYLAPYYRAYNTSARQLAMLAMPSDYTNFHVQMVNSFKLSAHAIASMQDFERDPLKGTLGLVSYATQIDASAEIIQTLKSFITQDNLAFSENEDGFLFYQYIDKG